MTPLKKSPHPAELCRVRNDVSQKEPRSAPAGPFACARSELSVLLCQSILNLPPRSQAVMNSHLRLQPNQRRSCARFLRFTLVWLIPLGCFAQQAPAPQQDPVPQQVSMPQDSCAFSAPGRCAIEIARDQTGILTSPFRMHKKDLLWLAPLAAATGAAPVSPRSPSPRTRSVRFPRSGSCARGASSRSRATATSTTR